MGLNVIEEQVMEYDIKEEEVDKRTRIFFLFLMMNLFLNYDTGVIPAALVQITEELNFNSEQIAYLGSLVYLGLWAATFFGSFVFQKFQAKWVICLMVFLNSIWWLIFALSYKIYVLYAARFVLGFTQAFVVIYAPVWINEFSPAEANTRWMAAFHSAWVIGILGGYIITQVIINNFSSYATWRFAIHIQAFWQFILSLIVVFVDNHNVDVKEKLSDEKLTILSNGNKSDNEGKETQEFVKHQKIKLSVKRIDTIDADEIGNLCNQFKILCTNYVFIFVTLWLCSVYFVVTGIQFWTTAYFLVILKEDPNVTLIMFSLVWITAPIAGVSVGSYFSDLNGGYKGENLLKAIKLWVFFGFFAFLFAFPIGFVNTLFLLIPLLWMLLFTGAMLTPTWTGIIVSSVARQYQTASSSMSQLINNLGGYFLAPVLSAYVMDWFDDPDRGFIWGYRVVLWWSIFGLIFIIWAWIYVSNAEKLQEDEYEDYQDVKNVQLEILRRQAQSYSI